jgi:hypothetical protein
MALIRAYQRFLSPSLGRNCRFSPTCSAYAIEAVGRYGTIRGTGMALKRLARCQPLVEGGYDPVPERI